MNNRNFKIKILNNDKLYIYELTYYSIFFNNLFLSIKSNKLILLNQILIYFWKRQNYYEKNLFKTLLKNEKFKTVNRLIRSNYIVHQTLNLQTVNVKNINPQYLIFIKKFFNFFFTFSNYIFSDFNTFHANFKLIYTIQVKNNFYLSANKHFLYWNKGFLFLYNLFYFNLNLILFGSKLFKKEILSFNWIHSIFDINLWNYSFLFFTFKVNSFNKQIRFFYSRLRKMKIKTIIISDCWYHLKNIQYFKKNRFYTIGLVNSNLNPWLVSYPIPILINNYFSQFFFLQIILLSYKYSLFLKYEFFKKLWMLFLINNN